MTKALIAARLGVTVGTVQRWSRAYTDWPPVRGYASVVQSGPGSTPWWDWEEDIIPFMDRHPTLKGDWSHAEIRND